MRASNTGILDDDDDKLHTTMMQHQGVAFRKVLDITNWFAVVSIAKGAWQAAVWLLSIVCT